MTSPSENSAIDDLLTSLDPPYELPQHKTIGRTLDKYGIPFFYRQPVMLYDQGRHFIDRPPFWLPAYGGAVIEYIEAKNSHEYRQRRHLLNDNQIPAVILTQEDLHTPNWQPNLYQKLEEIYHKTLGMLSENSYR